MKDLVMKLKLKVPQLKREKVERVLEQLQYNNQIVIKNCNNKFKLRKKLWLTLMIESKGVRKETKTKHQEIIIKANKVAVRASYSFQIFTKRLE